MYFLPLTVQSICNYTTYVSSQETQRCNRNNVLSFPKISIISATGGPTYEALILYIYILYILIAFSLQ